MEKLYSVELQHPLPNPSNLTVSNVSHNGAEISWNQPDSGSNHWWVQYSTDADFSTYAQQDADSTSLSLTGLYASTTYYVRVVNDCGTSEISSLSETASFTTLELCPAPTDLTVSNIGSYGAEISWSQPGDGSHWYVEYSTSPEFEASSTHSKLVETMMVTLTDLNVNTTYYVRVRNYCGNSGTSAWVTTNFTTEIGIALIVEIGNYGNITLYLPTYTGTKYSMTEQIYTAAEIGQAGEIHSIAFYNHGSAITRNIDLYLAHTDKDTFSTMTEWMPMTPADLVFSGNIDFLEWDWTVIEFSTPFAYNGTDNLMVLTNDNTGTIDDYRTFGVYSAPKQSLGVYNNNDNFDPANPSAGSYVGEKNHIQLGFFPTQCPGPTNITVSDITQHTATLAWTDNGGATAWDICLNGDEANAFTVTTNPYTLTGLSGETDYTVKIRTVCGDNGTSMWTGAKSFTTSALPCPVPTNFMVTNISNTSATLSWSENDISAEWQICVNGDEDNIIDVTTNSYTITDLTSETSYTVKVRANCDGESVWSVWSNESSFTTGTELVQIGTGTDTHSWLPTNTGRHYTLSQQIYTAAEIGQSGDIYSVAFYNTGDTTTRNLDLYMVHTNKNSLVSNDDWTAVTTADRVFSGSVHFQADDWTVINFSTPFSYNGTDNLLLTVDDNTGNGDYDIRDFLVFSTSNQSQAIVVFNNSTTNYDPADLSEYSGSRWSIKNQIQLSFVPDTSINPSYVHVEGETAVCQGNTTTLTATTDVEATYQWNTGATTQSIIVGSGSYSVTVTSSTGHELSGAVIVTEKETYDVDDYHSICSSELPIEWNGVTFTEAGMQTATITATNGCDSVVTLHLTTSVGIDDYELGAIYLIPNPAKNVCRINGLETAPVSVELYDMNGKLIRRINTAEFDVSTLSTGIYMVRVNTGNRVVNLKMVKQ